ncbi:zinc finger homeobox protein 2 [Brachypodium distachyon]|uniref:C2H2-type domain-containing protein n=1 Tax=Brachypodium distachyon TaxID=15368 RepID=I1I7E2_BRADI|nr:zinc finger homeobox protein 2 [Brachypodium distachyon]KQJ98428.1 hypothetical protein BRADI_3g36867v3 [Brachypodium distachyon]KQJ98429.1 hypothetical protein BRADI_3g36867v3 [Brachypodium distachyon]|eukprot:XP_010235166.1 zinc finger homeobox protein 2 [Brachypodium distachyon]
MEFARRAAARANADDIDGIPIPPPYAKMTVEALRQELLQEDIRQQIIVAELAERRKLEAEFERERGLHGDLGARLPQIIMPHRDTSPLPLVTTAPKPRRSVKDRIEEWYQPPWHRRAEEVDVSIDAAGLHTKTLSGVKRKRTAETLLWVCSICNVTCHRETDVQSHLRGRRHQEETENQQREGRDIEAKLHEKKAPQLADKNQKPVSRWKCGICNANCTSKSDLESHLQGRRHLKNVENQQRDGKDIEAKPHENKASQLDKNQKPASIWKCIICNASCSSKSDLESHLRGRRHHWNIQAQRLEGSS